MEEALEEALEVDGQADRIESLVYRDGLPHVSCTMDCRPDASYWMVLVFTC